MSVFLKTVQQPGIKRGWTDLCNRVEQIRWGLPSRADRFPFYVIASGIHCVYFLRQCGLRSGLVAKKAEKAPLRVGVTNPVVN